MPVVLLELLAKVGVAALEFVQKNWTGPPKKIVIKNKYATPCTVDCRKKGLSQD
jgi:hypothetical protein